MNKVTVNIDQCKAIAKVLQTLSVKSTVYQREYFRLDVSDEIKLRMFLFSIGICQQTHTLINKKLNLVGFNYLEKVFSDLAKMNSELLDPLFVKNQTPRALSDRFAVLFSETGDPKDCTLDRLDERSHLCIEMSQKLVDHYGGQVGALIAKSQGYLAGEQGIYQLLSDFEAYSDPFKKKSSLFATFSHQIGLFAIQDLEKLIPIMDYHMQRVLLRFGCVEVLDESLKKALINQEYVTSDEEIRSASIDAVHLLARYSGHSVLNIHDFLWPLGRSCCKEKPLCQSGLCDKSPCTFDSFVALPSRHTHCLFAGICKGSLKEEYRNLWQPLVETHYY
ncbi:MAG TPA: queuosine salvage family protein [Rhabdochlamydiaceae bacterium]|nr:queuosine salvage family protein [Rhabdochlamydiaceae bacterium]